MGEGVVEVTMWGYAEHIRDNVPHRHTFFEACQVGAYGRGRFITHGNEYTIQPGDVFIAWPGVEHEIVNSIHPEMELYWVAFQWISPCQAEQGGATALMDDFVKSSVVVVPDEDKRVAALWNALRTLFSGRLMLGYEAQACGLITALLLAIAQIMVDSKMLPLVEIGGSEPGEITVEHILRYIRDNLDRHSLSVSEIATHFCVSSRHLSRLFARFVGMPPTAYIARSRLDRARSLLLHTDTPIKEIAALTGYSDVQYFTRIFNHRFECPPARYRRQMEPYVYDLGQVTPP